MQPVENKLACHQIIYTHQTYVIWTCHNREPDCHTVSSLWWCRLARSFLYSISGKARASFSLLLPQNKHDKPAALSLPAGEPCAAEKTCLWFSVCHTNSIAPKSKKQKCNTLKYKTNTFKSSENNTTDPFHSWKSYDRPDFQSPHWTGRSPKCTPPSLTLCALVRSNTS